MIKKNLIIYFILIFPYWLNAQDLSPIKTLRADENYSNLLENDSVRNASFLNQLKAIPLTKDKSFYLRIGGEFRPRFEFTENKNWSVSAEADQRLYSQRIMFHADLHLGKYVRVFGQLTHGLVSLEEPVYVQSDNLDLHQAFAEFTIPIKSSTLQVENPIG